MTKSFDIYMAYERLKMRWPELGGCEECGDIRPFYQTPVYREDLREALEENDGYFIKYCHNEPGYQTEECGNKIRVFIGRDDTDPVEEVSCALNTAYELTQDGCLTAEGKEEEFNTAFQYLITIVKELSEENERLKLEDNHG